MSSKYATLPDLDQSQDIYETPDLADDVSTLPTSLSIGSRSGDEDDDDRSSTLSVIDHGHLRPSEAATRFRNSHIDATDVDFSDRIASKRKSYVASTRRSRRRQTGFDDYGDEEEEEVGGSGGEADSLERRLAMLRREVEELRAEVNKKKEQAENGETVVKPETSSGIEEVATMLSALEGDGKGRGAQARLARKMATSLGVVGQVTREIPGPSAEDPGEKDQTSTSGEAGSTATYTITYSPAYNKSHTMIRVAQFDQRLTLLEKVLGVSASAVVNVDRQLPSNAMIPTLDELSRQMGVLNTSTIASLDAASRRVKQLLSDAEKLADARKAAKSMTVDDGSSIDSLENEETISKINALYGVLPTIEKTTPLLFAILDRLRSLRAIHQDAATSSETLKKIESRQDEIGAEIKTWEESLVNMEGLVKEGQGTIESNMGKVEGWVKELEEKMMAVK